MSGRTAFGVNLGFKKLPGGTIATTGPLRVEGGLEADSATFAGPLLAPNVGPQRSTWVQNVFPDNQLSGWSAPGDKTYLLRITAPCAFGAFRLRIPSGGGDAMQYSCAVSGEELNNGSSWAWKQIPINGSTDPYTRDDVGGSKWTDWMLLPSVPRLDGSSRPYLFIRCYGVASVYKAFSVQAAVCEKQYALYGADATAYTAVGGNRLTTLGLAPTYGTSVQINVLGVEYAPVDALPVYTIAGSGDSLDQGWNRTATDLQWQPMISEADNRLKSLGYRSSSYSLAKSGQVHSAAMSDIDTILAQCTPDFVVIPPWSPNDGNSDLLVATTWAQTLATIKKLQGLGIVPVVRTITPFGFTGDNESRRQALNAMVRNLRGVVVADADAAVRDPDNPSALIPTMKDPAGIDNHLSKLGTRTAGYAIGDAIAAWIRAQ